VNTARRPRAGYELHHLVGAAEWGVDARIEVRLDPDDIIGRRIRHHLANQAAQVLRSCHGQVEGRLKALLEVVEVREGPWIRDSSTASSTIVVCRIAPSR
jgi:hypothetical protein